ncbi:hypothetical protein FACS1894152_2060 [Bacilli bacterium]|nr:hypothetical protein FACS1894152_2060 [Bacilli bacterium]
MVSAEAGVLLEISYFYNREGKVEKLLARSEKQGWTEPFSNSLFHKDSTWIKSKENITLTHRNGSKLKKPLVLTKDMDSLDQLRSAIDESYPYNHYDKVDTLIRCSKGNFLDRLLMGLGIDL